jgi:hypothetical protein
MRALPPDYLAEIARQLAFLSAFLGGFAATFLATLVVAGSPKRVAGWTILSSAFAAVAFIVSVSASVMMTIVLHPNAPPRITSSSAIENARLASALAFLVGTYAILVTVGLSGWIRSRRAGIATLLIAGLGIWLVTWALAGFK